MEILTIIKFFLNSSIVLQKSGGPGYFNGAKQCAKPGQLENEAPEATKV